MKRASTNLLLLTTVLVAACSGSPIAQQARVLATVSTLIETAADGYDTAREASVDRVQRASLGQPSADRVVLVTAEEDRWRPGDRAFDLAQMTIATWAASLRLAADAGGGSDLLLPLTRVAARAIALYAGLVDLAHSVGFDLPALPTWITALVAAGGGS